MLSDAGEWLDRFSFAAPFGGLPIVKCEPSGVAFASGLRAGDVIVGVNMTDCRPLSSAQTVQLVKEARRGEVLGLQVLRCENLGFDPEVLMAMSEATDGRAVRGPVAKPSPFFASLASRLCLLALPQLEPLPLPSA